MHQVRRVSSLDMAAVPEGAATPLGSWGAGTPLYSAPETARGRFTPASDVFSCGLVLFELWYLLVI